MRAISTTALAVLMTALTSTVASAQTRPAGPPRPNRAAAAPRSPNDSQPGMRRPTPRQPGVGRLGGGPASGLLRMREQLALTDDQVTKLEALQAAPRPERNQSDMMRAQADLLDATKGDLNLEKARAAFDRMSRLRTDEQLAQLKVRQDVRNVLTPAQRTKFDAFSANMRQRRGAPGAAGRRGNDMRNGAMRGPGGRQGAMGAGRRGPAGPGARGGMRGPGMGAPGMRTPGMGAPGMGGQGFGAQGMNPPAPRRRPPG